MWTKSQCSHLLKNSYPASIFTCSNTTIETLEKGVKYVQSKTIKTPKRRQWRRSDVFIVNFKHISHFFLMFLLLTLDRWILARITKTFFMQCPLHLHTNLMKNLARNHYYLKSDWFLVCSKLFRFWKICLENIFPKAWGGNVFSVFYCFSS